MKQQQLQSYHISTRNLVVSYLPIMFWQEAVRLASSSTANARALFKRRESEADDQPVSRAPPPPK